MHMRIEQKECTQPSNSLVLILSGFSRANGLPKILPTRQNYGKVPVLIL